MDASVVVPTRNRNAMLATTLHSVLRQRHIDLEVIVVDDASSDDTPEVLRALADPRVRTIRNDAAVGPNAARNLGAREARGRWVAFVDDDDLWAPDKLAPQLRAAEDAGRDWAYAGSVNVDERLRVIHGIPPPTPAEVLAEVHRSNPIPASASNVAIRRSSFEAAEGFNQDLRTCEEWDLWIRLADRGAPACVPEPLVAYRMHPGNAILDVRAIVDGARTLERLHGIEIDWGRFHRWIAQSCIRGGDRPRALIHYARAAAAGEGRRVGAELAALARRGLRGRLGRPAPPVAPRPDRDWEDRARGWIDELRQLQTGTLDGQP